MAQTAIVRAVVESRGGLSVVIYEAQAVFMEHKGLNKGDKCLRVRNLLRQWKADIIFKKKFYK
jgi:hypothetical protein